MNAKEIVASVFGLAFKIVAAVLIVMFTYKYALLAYDYGYRIFGETPLTSGEGRKVTVTIEEDDDVKKIGEILENKGLIRDGELFVLQELISDYHNDLLPGTYELNTSMTAEQMMEVMSTVPEPAEEEEPQDEGGDDFGDDLFFEDTNNESDNGGFDFDEDFYR